MQGPGVWGAGLGGQNSGSWPGTSHLLPSISSCLWGGYTGHPGSSQVKQVENEVVTGVQYCSRVVAHKDVRDTGIEILVILT